MDKFGYPTNVKQIGNVDENLRIYIEDYVYSYLLQYAESGGDEERIAALIGRCMIIDGQTVLFINGAIQGKYAEHEKGILVFNQKSFDYIESQCEKYFKGLEIVGWMQSQPNYGNFLSASYANYHISNFKKSYQVMLVTDPIERINSFFIWNEDRTDIEESKGFFIYYDKNKSMHNYILENKIVKLNQNDEIPTAKIIRLKDKVDKQEEVDEEKTEQEEVYVEQKRISNKKLRGRKNLRSANLIAVACGLLFVVGFGVSTSLVESRRKIAKLENDISTIRVAYNGLVTHINENGVQPVFASSATVMEVDGSEVKTEVVVDIPQETEETEETEENQSPEERDDIAPTTEENIDAESNDVPEETPQPSQQGNVSQTSLLPESYVIQQGDSLINISKKFYGTTNMQQKIMDANGIDDPNKIYFGMILKLPTDN